MLTLKRVIVHGMHGSDVEACSRALIRWNKGELANVRVIWDDHCVVLCKKFQKAMKLQQDGEVGAKTLTQLVRFMDAYAKSLYGAFHITGLILPVSYVATHQTAGLPGYPAIDILASSPGEPVLCPVNGVVDRLSGRTPTYVRPGGAFGWSIYISVPNARRPKFRYFLTHFGSRTVTGGQVVAPDDVLGTVGNFFHYSGGVTPNHIHEGKHAY